MANKERFQNPVVGDTIKLRLFTYNANNLANVSSVDKIEIYYLDPTLTSDSNPDGRTLIETIATDSVTTEDTGKYYTDLVTSNPTYVIGQYVDVWHVEFESNEPSGEITNYFEILPDLWYTTPSPIIYDFSFRFRPNKIRKKSKIYLCIEIEPNVPRATDLSRYYENLAILAGLKVSIEQRCGDCVPEEKDLRLLVDAADVDFREKKYGYYLLDTTDMDAGMYDIWFHLDVGETSHISETMQFQVYE